MHDPKDIACPTCFAARGRPCNQPTNTGRRDVTWFHHSRTDATIPTGPINVTYRVSAMVNGKRRNVIMPGPRGLSSYDVMRDLLFNIEDNYRRFYRGASAEDYEAELEDPLVEVHDWSEVS